MNGRAITTIAVGIAVIAILVIILAIEPSSLRPINPVAVTRFAIEQCEKVEGEIVAANGFECKCQSSLLTLSGKFAHCRACLANYASNIPEPYIT